MKRVFLGLLAILLVLIGGGYLYLFEADIAHDELVAQYGGKASRFLILPDGSRAHYRDQGNPEGPALVLLHGSNSSLHTWEGWVTALGETFRIISIDLPGHGMTGRTTDDDYSSEGMNRFVLAVAEALNVPRFALAGNSMGGAIAARFALAYPERVTKLILVDAGGLPPPEAEQEVPLVFQLMGKPVIGDLLVYITPRELVGDAVRGIYSDKSKVNDALIDRYFHMNLHAGNRAATKFRVQVPYDTTLAQTMSGIVQPTLILWGAEDHLTPLSMGNAFAAGIPNSRMHIFSGAGHVPMEEIPAESAAVALSFLSE